MAEEKLENMRISGDGAPAEEDDDVVDPWNVQSKSDKGIDYDKLISMLLLYTCIIKIKRPYCIM